MRTLYTADISRKTKRTPARIVGYYNTPEAAAELGVDPSTLRYRRDHADAKTYWEMLGLSVTDPMNEELAKSHMIRDGQHYYEKKAFDKFVKMYLARPEVIRARKAQLTFSKPKAPMLHVTLTKQQDIELLAMHLATLLEADGQVTLSVFEP